MKPIRLRRGFMPHCRISVSDGLRRQFVKKPIPEREWRRGATEARGDGGEASSPLHDGMWCQMIRQRGAAKLCLAST